MHGRSHLAIDRRRRLRHALEVRHESFRDAAFVRMLRRHRVALVVSDGAGRWPRCEDVTADFVYVRLHGSRELYASRYTDAEIAAWAARIRAWASGGQPADAACSLALAPPRRASRDVYCYFDNDAKVMAPFDAQRLARALGLRADVQRPWRALTGAARAARSASSTRRPIGAPAG